MKRLPILTIVFLAAVMLLSCGRSSGEPAVRELFAMDTVFDLTIYGKNAEAAADAAEKEIARLERLFSVTDQDSEIGKLNADGSGKVGEENGLLIGKSLDLYRETDGAFDIAIYPLVRAYGFPTKEYRIPSEEEIASILPLLDAGNIRYDGSAGTVSFEKEDMAVDLGGIAKGYTGDSLAAMLENAGIKSAILSLGGNVQAIGSKPDGSAWRVGIRDPQDPDGMIGVLSANDTAVVSSGSYERNFTIGDVTIHHILDPKTGRPAAGGLSQVTVVMKSGTDADALSTALFVMGKEKALDFWRSRGDFECILVEEDGSVSVTEGIADAFKTDRDVTVIAGGK